MKKINNHTRTEISRFIPSTGICEYHAIIHITRPELTFDQQLSALLDAYDYLLKHEANGAKAVFKRFFLSDAANQQVLWSVRLQVVLRASQSRMVRVCRSPQS